MNEESVGNVMSYFNELKQQQESKQMGSMNVRQTNIGHSATQGNVINAYQTSQRSNELGVSGQLSFNQQVIDQQMQLHSQNKVYTMGMRNSSTLNSQEVVG